MHAHGVPIAVPLFWRQNVFPNWNILFSMTSLSSFMMKSVGYIPIVLKFSRYFSSVSVPSCCVISEYMDIASDVSSLEPGGKGPFCLSSCTTWYEFWT